VQDAVLPRLLVRPRDAAVAAAVQAPVRQQAGQQIPPPAVVVLPVRRLAIVAVGRVVPVVSLPECSKSEDDRGLCTADSELRRMAASLDIGWSVFEQGENRISCHPLVAADRCPGLLQIRLLLLPGLRVWAMIGGVARAACV